LAHPDIAAFLGGYTAGAFTRARSAPASAGELAARACELFREGKSAVDVVIALRQPFDAVLEWQRSYVAASGCLFVPDAVASKMKERFFLEVEPFTSDGLYRLLERLTNRNIDLSRRLRVVDERTPSGESPPGSLSATAVAYEDVCRPVYTAARIGTRRISIASM